MGSDNVTQDNKTNLLDLIHKMRLIYIKEELRKKVESKPLSQMDSTVEYYLKDVSDKDRYKTAWLYVEEYVKNDSYKAKLFSLIVTDFANSMDVTAINKKNLQECIGHLRTRKQFYS